MTRRRLLGPIGSRLALAFLAVALAAIGVLTVLTIAATRTQVGDLVRRQRQDRAGAAAAAAGQAYDAAGGWSEADLTSVSAVAAAAGAQLEIRDAADVPVASVRAHRSMMVDLMARMHRDVPPAMGGVISLGAPVTAPVRADGRIVGTVLLRFPAGTLPAPEARVRDALSAVMGVGAALAALMALAAAILMSRRLTRPLVLLTGAVQATEAGDRDVRSGLQRAPGELGELAVAFDRMADTLARQDRLRRALVADVAHELRTPVTILQASCEALVDGIEAPSPERLAALRDEVLRLGRLVEDLEALSAAEAAGLHLERRPIDLATIASEAVESLRSRAADAGLTVETELSSVAVEADPARLHQTVVNLLTNAIKFTPPGGTVLVHVAGDGELARLDVSDNGPGIDNDEIAHVFDRFWRGRDAARASGSGVGLAVVAELVRAHHGRVDVTSQLGQGTTFTVLLPRP